MAKKIETVSDKLVKINESFTINIYDNGYMIEVGGRDSNDDWKTAKILVATDDELVSLVRETISMSRAE